MQEEGNELRQVLSKRKSGLEDVENSQVFQNQFVISTLTHVLMLLLPLDGSSCSLPVQIQPIECQLPNKVCLGLFSHVGIFSCEFL